jgi:hypothetical protein
VASQLSQHADVSGAAQAARAEHERHTNSFRLVIHDDPLSVYSLSTLKSHLRSRLELSRCALKVDR